MKFPISPNSGCSGRAYSERVNALRQQYGPGPLDVNRPRLAELARDVRLTESSIVNSDVERRSSKTGQHHGLGGFTGSVTYEGEVSEFLPFLKAAEFTGVGRHTVWGNGELGLNF